MGKVLICNEKRRCCAIWLFPLSGKNTGIPLVLLFEINDLQHSWISGADRQDAGTGENPKPQKKEKP
jgi:hypothetical protein